MSRAARKSDKSNAAHEIPLEDSNGFHQRYIGIREARRMVYDGTARGSYAPYRMGTPAEERELIKISLTSSRVPSYRVQPIITRGEGEAAIGLHGPSRTLHLSEEQRRRRVQKIRDERNRIVGEEDHIERAMFKIAVMPLEHDHRNPATVGQRLDLAALEPFAAILEAAL